MPTHPSTDDPAQDHRLRRLAWVFAATLLLLTWAAVAALLKLRWDDTLAQETLQNTNLARALQEQTTRVLATVDQACLRVRDEVAAGNRAPDLARFANETGLAPKILVQLSLVGPDGHFVASNLDPDGSKTGPVNLYEREHVQVHLRPGSATMAGNGLFIGKPVLGKVSGRWTIQLSRLIRNGAGRTLGVTVASLDPAYFEEVYKRVALGRSGGVALACADMTIRARVIGGRPAQMGSTMSAADGFPSGPTVAEGHYISRSAGDEVERIYSYRQVGDYPLYVFVFSALEEAMARWRSSRNVMLALASLLTMAVTGAAALLLTHLRQLQASHGALRLSEARALSANQAKSAFLAAISHELRAPLTSIRGHAELMEHRIEQPRFKEQAGLIRKAAEHLSTLLNEVLDLARVESGTMAVHPAPQALRPLLQGSCDLFAMAASAKGLQLRLEVAPGAPETLHCDGLRLTQILNNLLSNAVKFTHQGGITLALDTQPGQICFHVVDSGPGMAPELQEQVFERQHQGDDRIAFAHGGTGLGLSLSRALAGLMGGRLSLQSQPGQGAHFTLCLPTEPTEQA